MEQKKKYNAQKEIYEKDEHMLWKLRTGKP